MDLILCGGPYSGPISIDYRAPGGIVRTVVIDGTTYTFKGQVRDGLPIFEHPAHLAHRPGILDRLQAWLAGK